MLSTLNKTTTAKTNNKYATNICREKETIGGSK